MSRTPAQQSAVIAPRGSRRACSSKRLRSDRGAAAVEFALVVPVLLVLVLGIVEFGRAYNIQTTLSAAAREGVRTMALQNSAPAARTSAKSAAAPAVTLTDGQISVSAACPVAGTNTSATVTVTINYPLTFITNFFGTAPNLTATGVMRCNG